MCRLLGYCGAEPLIMNSLLDHYENSLVIQSKRAQETLTGLNADGFGLGWYDHTIDSTPALFKSTQPAWNDLNLRNLAAKVRSKCFIGHVRASTVGDVSRANCHPFVFGPLLCAHNGTVKDFDKIKRHLIDQLNEETFLSLKGTTDSEHLFALMATLYQARHPKTPESLVDNSRETIKKIHTLQKEASASTCIRANLLLSTGHNLIALRYCANNLSPPLSMYFSKVQVGKSGNTLDFMGDSKSGNGVVISSEHLTEEALWIEVPLNSFVVVSPDHTVKLIPF